MVGRRQLLICAGLVAATSALYAPVLDYEFVRFDDPRVVSENPYIADGIGFDVAIWSFTHSYKSLAARPGGDSW